MESTELSMGQLLTRMRVRGITARKLSCEAGIAPQNFSAILHGRQGLGDDRRERIECAIAALGLDREDAPPLRVRGLAGLKFRISVL